MNDENEVGKNMLEQATGAFLMPWTRKPTGKAAKGGKGQSKASKPAQGMPKTMTRSRGKGPSRGSYNKKQNAGGNWF